MAVTIDGSDAIGDLGDALDAKANYESGTFTPTAFGNSSAGTPTYSVQEGQYVKVGRLVFFAINIAWSAFSGGSGNIRIGGLPYTCLANNWCAVSVYNNGFSFNQQQLGAYVSAGDEHLVLVTWNTSGVINEQSIDTSVDRLMFTGHYFANT